LGNSWNAESLQQNGFPKEGGVPMLKETIKTARVSDPVGPYSLAVKASGTFLFISGMVGFGPDGKVVKGGFATQCRQAYENIKAILEEAGGSFENVIRFTNYLIDAKNYPIMAEIRKEYLEGVKDFPGSTLIEVKGLLFKDLLVEIDTIAVF
jgi:2-iminobutanoate/2-iminopropanoate deaminase